MKKVEYKEINGIRWKITYTPDDMRSTYITVLGYKPSNKIIWPFPQPMFFDLTYTFQTDDIENIALSMIRSYFNRQQAQKSFFKEFSKNY